MENHLPNNPVNSFEPDLCLDLGAALQAGMLAGEAVDAILVDVTPHLLTIAAIMDSPVGPIPGMFSTIIPRRSIIPTSRSEVYITSVHQQEIVEVEVFQGENPITQENVSLGAFRVEGLPLKPAGAVQVV